MPLPVYNFFGTQFPALPASARQQNAPQPQRYGPAMPTYQVPWQDTPRWTPPQDEARPQPPNVSPMRQVNAPPPRPVVLPPMRQVNQMDAPVVPTTQAPPLVPLLRNAAAIPPIAPPLVQAAKGIFGALPGLVEAAQQVAPVALPAMLEASPTMRAILGSRQLRAAAPTDPQNFGEEWQVAKSRGVGGGALYLGSRPWEVGLDEITDFRNPVTAMFGEPYWAHNWAESSPQDYSQKVSDYRERKGELQRRELELTEAARNGAYDPAALERLQQESFALERGMISDFFERGARGQMERGAPIYGQAQGNGNAATGYAAYREWQQNEAQRAWQTYLNKTPEQKKQDVARFREEAPAMLQLLIGAVFDPLNFADGLAEVNNIRRIAKVARLTGPAVARGGRILAKADVAAEDARAVERANSWLGRHTPWQMTPESMAHATVVQSGDTVTRLAEAARDAIQNNHELAKRIAGDDDLLTGIFRKAMQNPDDADIAQLTGGFSQSRQFKRTTNLLDKVFGTVDEATVAKQTAAKTAALNQADALAKRADDLAAAGKDATKARQAADAARAVAEQITVERPGDIDFGKLAKLIDEADGDDIAAVSALAQQYEQAARQMYAKPVMKQVAGLGEVTEYRFPREDSRARAFRGTVSNAVSTMFLGTNPGYAFRNAANNLFTAVVDGVSPVQSADSLRDLWTRWGPAPWMTKQGVGSAGDIWKSRAAAEKYITSISEPMRLRDVFKAVEAPTLKDKLGITLQVGQNFERYASERIMAHHIRNYWQQVWPKTVRRITNGLIEQGFTPAQITELQQRLDRAMSPKEARRIIDEFINGQAAAGGNAAGPVAPASGAPPTPLTLPLDVREAALRAGGPDAVAALEDVARVSKTPQEAVLRVEVRAAAEQAQADMTEAIAAVRVKADDWLDGRTRDDLLAYLDQSVAFVSKAQDADIALVAEAMRGLDGVTDKAIRSAVWQETRQLRRRNRLAVMDALNQLDAELMPELGFDAAAVTRAKAYRMKVADTWDKSDRLIENFWRDKEKGLKGASAADVYEVVQRERKRLWDGMQAERRLHVQRFDEEIERALGRLKQGGGGLDEPPPAAAPMPEPVAPKPDAGGGNGVAVPTPERMPEAAAQIADVERVAEVAPVPPASAAPDPAILPQLRAPTDNELRTAAKDAGIATTSADGKKPTDRWLLNFARKQTEVDAKKLTDLNDAERQAVMDALRQRAEKGKTAAPLPQPPPAVAPQSSDREALRRRIAESAREKNEPQFVKRSTVKGDNGNWYSALGGLPAGVQPTGEERIYFVRKMPDGTTAGQQYATLNEAQTAWQAQQEQRVASVYDALKNESDAQLQERARALNLQEAAKLAAPPAPPPPAASHVEQWRAEVTRLKQRRSLTATDENVLKLYEQRLAADPAKWAVGHGVSYKVVSGGRATQTNRGFTIVEIDAADKMARVRQVADTGLTASGGNMDRGGDVWVPLGDLTRDRKYDLDMAKIAARKTAAPTVAQPAAVEPAAPAPVAKQLTGAPGKAVMAYGTDPNRQYEFRYRVVSLDGLTPSQTDALTPNPAYPAELQPRIRDRAASRLQIEQMAQNLQADALLGDFRSLDRGPMIVGPDAVVESGNGRVMALRKARAEAPARWQAYQTRLVEVAPEYGIDPQELVGIKDPVLVRERVTPVDRVKFTAEANEQATLAMSPVEQALQDAGRVQDRLLATLEVGDTQWVDQALTSTANRPIVKAFVDAIPANERAAIVTADGSLNAQGLARLKSALFAKTYPGDAGRRLAQTFIESLDPGIKNLEAGMFASLPKMSHAESLVRAGERAADLALGDDLAAVVDTLARLKQQGIKTADYLAQISLFGDELTPFQKELLAYLDEINRKPKQIREFLNAYADAVESAQNPAQIGTFGDEGLTKEGIFGRIREEQAAASFQQPGLFGEGRSGQANPPAFGSERQGLAQPAVRSGTGPREGQAEREVRFEQAVPWNPRGGLNAQPLGQLPLNAADARAVSARAMSAVWTDFKRALSGAPAQLPPVTPEQARVLRDLLNQQIVPQMVKSKAMVNNLATEMRNFALGDYQNKRMFHEWLAYLMPWSYWYTFTFPNWAQRLATHPYWISNYARYKAALAKTNREYYRAVMNDPTAEMPEYWEDQLRVPFFGTQLYFDLERTLMPLQTLLNDFKSRVKGDVPGQFPFPSGEVMQQIGEWGPSLHPAITWAYAAWLSSHGYREASDEWVGYLFPWSRALKGATAIAREPQIQVGPLTVNNPLASTMQQIIPPGGFTPEQTFLDNVKGGDVWERRRIGYQLYTLWKQGKISETEFQDAAYTQRGPAWDMARQAEAVNRAPGNLASYLFGAGFKPRNLSDIEIDRMRNEWGKIWDARSSGADEATWRKLLADFEKKYPWAAAVKMGAESDPTNRLKDYGFAVLDRLPPGAQRKELLAQAGIDQSLLSRFYDDKGDTSKWTPADVKRLQGGIEKLAELVKVPDARTQAEYDGARQAKAQLEAQAAKAAGTPLDQIKAKEQRYYEIKDQQGADAAKAYLKANPDLGKYWDAKSKAEKSAEYQKYFPQKAQTAEQKEKAALAERYAAAEKKFGAEVAAWADEYSALPKGAARTAWRKANPEKWAKVEAYYTFIYPKNKTTNKSSGSGSWQRYVPLYPPRTYSYGGGRSYGGYGGGGRTSGSIPMPPVMPGPVMPTEPPAYEKWTAQEFANIAQQERQDDPVFDTLVGVMFGSDMLGVANSYYGMDATQRADWISKNPQLWARLLRFLLWLMKQTGVKTDYSAMLASVPPNAPNAPVAPPASIPANAPALR